MEEKERAVVAKGHEEGIKLANSILDEFGLPLGLLPLADVIEVSFVRKHWLHVDPAKEEG